MSEPTPDHVPCRHCGEPISWDEICWTHDSTGFADCGVTISGGTDMGGGVLIDAEITTTRSTHALPIGEWS